MKYKIEDQINHFLTLMNCERLKAFMLDVLPLFELYNVDEEQDWVEELVEDANNVRLIRTCYLMSKIASNHSYILSKLQKRFKNLFKLMEQEIA